MIRLGFSEKKHTEKYTDVETTQAYAYQMHVEFFVKIWCFMQTLIRNIEDKQGPQKGESWCNVDQLLQAFRMPRA